MAEEDVQLACAPRSFRVLPGEPARVELKIQTRSAAPVRLHVPEHSLLMLRAVEKFPVQRTREGAVVHKRVLIWQALEPGTAKVTGLSVETPGGKRMFPEIEITVRAP